MRNVRVSSWQSSGSVHIHEFIQAKEHLAVVGEITALLEKVAALREFICFGRTIKTEGVSASDSLFHIASSGDALRESSSP